MRANRYYIYMFYYSFAMMGGLILYDSQSYILIIDVIILFLPESTEGVAVGATTAMDYENAADSTENDAETVTKQDRLNKNRADFEKLLKCVPSVLCLQKRAGQCSKHIIVRQSVLCAFDSFRQEVQSQTHSQKGCNSHRQFQARRYGIDTQGAIPTENGLC